MNSSVLIITINYNQTDYSIQCVKSIFESDYNNLQILLIDNGSTEENYKELKQKIPSDSRIILKRIEKNTGYVGGVNCGLIESAKINVEYIVIMNNDTIIDSKAISALVRTAKKWNNNAIVTGKVCFYDNPKMIQTVGFKFKNKRILTTYKIGEGQLDTGQFEEESERDLIDDIFWLFPIDFVSTLGLYPINYGFGYEQADWAMAAKISGHKLIYTPDAKLLHKENATVGKKLSPYKIYWYVQGRLMFQWKYISKLAFSQSYFLAIIEILSALYYDVLRIFSKSIETRFPLIKLLAFIRFHIWIIFKMDKDKFISKKIK